MVTARPAPHSPSFRVTVWTEGGRPGGGAAVVTPRHPLSAHVMVERGGQPVLGAAVTLLVSLTLPHNGSTTQLPPLQLRDGGGGAADLVAEDGVYSRYLVRYPGPGLYTLGVAVAGAGGTVVAGAGQHPGQDCCGSSTLASRHSAPRTGAFSRLVAGAASVLVAEVPAGAGDRMPPARVGDLRAARLPSGGVRLVFTARRAPPWRRRSRCAAVTSTLEWSRWTRRVTRGRCPTSCSVRAFKTHSQPEVCIQTGKFVKKIRIQN